MKKGFNIIIYIVAGFILLPYIFGLLVMGGDGGMSTLRPLLIGDILLGTGTGLGILFLYNKYKDNKKPRSFTPSINVNHMNNNTDENKVVRVDKIENNTNQKIYEIVYVNIENGKKKKEVVVEGHRLFNKINNKLLTEGDNFYE